MFWNGQVKVQTIIQLNDVEVPEASSSKEETHQHHRAEVVLY